MEDKTALQGEPRLAQRLQLAEAGAPAGGAARIEDQHRRGKPMARERIELLLDEGSFEEFDILKTGRGDYTDQERRYPGDGVITHGNIPL